MDVAFHENGRTMGHRERAKTESLALCCAQCNYMRWFVYRIVVDNE